MVLKITKDALTVVFGTLYTLLTIGFGIFVYSSLEIYGGDIRQIVLLLVINTFGGIIFLFLSIILNLVFFLSSRGNTSGKVGFGFGIVAWILFLIRWLFGNFPNPILFLIRWFFGNFPNPNLPNPDLFIGIVLGLILFGSILFSRCYSDKVLATLYRPHSNNRRPNTQRSQSQTSRNHRQQMCPRCGRETEYTPDGYYCSHCSRYISNDSLSSF